MTANAPFQPDNPAVMAHVSMLQGIISRLANNSVSCKTWCFTLVTGLVALTGATGRPDVIVVVVVPLVIFGFLDASYLARERAYRTLYAKVLGKLHGGSYTLADTFEASASVAWVAPIKAFFSWSVAPLYLTLVVLTVLAHLCGWLALLMSG